MMKKLPWQSIALPGHAFYLARCEYPATKRFAPHTHDFAEITLIESGETKIICLVKCQLLPSLKHLVKFGLAKIELEFYIYFIEED